MALPKRLDDVTRRGMAMAKLSRCLRGAEPVDRAGGVVGPPATLPAGTAFHITVPKLIRRGDSFDVYWCEFEADGGLYRVPLRMFENANAL